MPELGSDTLLALEGAADIVVREYRQTHPEAEAAVIKRVSNGQAQRFEDWGRLCRRVERVSKGGLQRSGEWCLGHLPEGPLDPTTQPGGATRLKKAQQEGDPRSTSRASAGRW